MKYIANGYIIYYIYIYIEFIFTVIAHTSTSSNIVVAAHSST